MQVAGPPRLASEVLQPAKPEGVTLNCRRIATIAIVAVVGIGLTACGKSVPAKGQPRTPKPEQSAAGKKRPINPGANNPTIVGVDPSKLTGEIGKYVRRQEIQAEVARQEQKWIRPPDLDLGECRVNGIKKGTCTFMNPTSKTQYIRSIRKTCTCQKVVVRFNDKEIEVTGVLGDKIEVPPGAKGAIDIYMKVDSLGKKVTEVVVETTDPDTRVIQVRASAIGIREFLTEYQGQITSSVYFSGLLTTRTKRNFEVHVRPKSKKPFKIIGHSLLPRGLKLAYKPVEHDGTDGLEWLITGQFGPGLPEGSAGGEVEFKTDRSGGFTLQFQGFVSPPITIEPAGALSFARIQPHKGETRLIRLSAANTEDNFMVDRVEVVEARIAGKPVDAKLFEFKIVKLDDRHTNIAVTVPPKMPGGFLNGKLRIHFKEQELKPRELTFFGFVRT